MDTRPDTYQGDAASSAPAKHDPQPNTEHDETPAPWPVRGGFERGTENDLKSQPRV